MTGTVASRLTLEDHEYKSVVISGLTVVGMGWKNTAYGFVGMWPDDGAPAVDRTKAKAAEVHIGR